MFIRPKVVSFTGATVLITGGATGIGRLMALGAADRGAKAIIIWNRNATRGQEVVDELKAAHPHIKAKHYSVDVSDAESVHSNAQAVLAEFERVDILINNAGVVNGKPVLELSEEEIRRTVEVNTLSLFRTVREFLPGMLQRDYGSIVTISSAAGLVGLRNNLTTMSPSSVPSGSRSLCERNCASSVRMYTPCSIAPTIFPPVCSMELRRNSLVCYRFSSRKIVLIRC